MMISFAGVDEQTYPFSNLCANVTSGCFVGVYCYFPDFSTGFWFRHERGGGQVFVLVRSTFESGRAQTCGAICCIIFAFMGRLSARSRPLPLLAQSGRRHGHASAILELLI